MHLLFKRALSKMLLISTVLFFNFIMLSMGQRLVQENLQEFDPFQDNDLIITTKQHNVLKEFRTLVSSRLPHEYMKSDIYLIRWLRARKFNIYAAENMLMENLRWRKDKNIDNILNEDWALFEKDYRFAVEGCDRGGRPVISVPVGDWDIRKAVISGQSQKIMRYFDKLFEEISVIMRNSQEQGKNISQYDHIFELSNYNLVLQGCPLCIPVYIHFFQSYENHYPGNNFKTTCVNVPNIFLSLWSVMRPFMSPASKRAISLYGKDKRQWQKSLSKYIDKTHLTKEFGGLKDEPVQLEEIRASGNYFDCSKYAYKG